MIKKVEKNRMIQKHKDDNNLRAFMDEATHLYNIMPREGPDGLRVPSVEQRKQILEIARKHAKGEDEAQMFVDYARKLWEADVFG